MSEVLIKGVKIPRTCDMCWALDDYGDYPRCRITGEQRGYNFPVREKRMDKCPLISVPTPHGRLKDADALIKELKECMYAANNNWEYEMVTGYSNAIESVEEACTIIEAEGNL